MIFRQLFDDESSTYTYFLGDPAAGVAALVDPVRERVADYEALLGRLGLRLQASFETHTHADHVTAAATLRDRTGCELFISHAAKATCANHFLHDGERITVGGVEIRALETPGHTPCSLSYLVGDDRVLTGDALLIGGCGRTDFQSGDAAELWQSVTGKLFTLPPDTLVFPGHDYNGNTVSTVKQERAKNPRFSGKTRDDFIVLMANLNLAPPKKIAESLPANEHCGRL